MFKEIYSDLILVFWLFLPAGIANMFPVFLARIPLLDKLNAPLDFGTAWRGTRVLGDHKTWRGLIGGVIIGGLVCYGQSLITPNFSFPINPFLFGALLGAGALLGDSIKSFFKRQIGISSGQSWLPFDQIDYILGAIVIASPFFRLSLRQYLMAILVWFALHLITVLIGYFLHLRKDVI